MSNKTPRTRTRFNNHVSVNFCPFCTYFLNGIYLFHVEFVIHSWLVTPIRCALLTQSIFIELSLYVWVLQKLYCYNLNLLRNRYLRVFLPIWNEIMLVLFLCTLNLPPNSIPESRGLTFDYLTPLRFKFLFLLLMALVPISLLGSML